MTEADPKQASPKPRKLAGLTPMKVKKPQTKKVKRKQVGDRTKNPLPDHDYSQSQTKDGGNEMNSEGGDSGRD